ncbi:MAG: LPS-assembly protein LptD, partial [Elusimicrobia bacterium]|nr:LPS-assembly protein LptD [Elusimicrobiota bacterium]
MLALFAGAARAEKDYELTPSTGNSTIEFYSDSFDYQKSSSIVVLKGQVEVFDSTWTMRAEQVVIDLTSQRAQASGRVQISDGKSVLLGQNGYFDFAARESYVEEASGGYPPWIFKGRFLRVRKSKFIYKHARFTSCAEENAHYHFTASRLTVFPDHYLLGSNIFLYLGPIPVFYLPVVYRSLSPKHLWVTRVRPGYDKRNGGQFQTATDFNLGPFAWTRLYLDYFQKEGIGSGLELNYRRNDRLKGTLYGYHIHETTSRKDRWTFLGNHWQQLSPIYSAQGRLQILSDPQFNNLYFRSNAFRIAPQLDNSAAIVRQTPQSTLRLSVSRLDMQNLAADRFERADGKIPRLDFQSAPFQLFGLTPLNSIQAFAEHATEVETA